MKKIEEIEIANASEAWFIAAGRYPTSEAGLYLMWFGQVGTSRVYVWADSFESAFEEAVEWLDDKKYAGYFTTLDESDFRDVAENLGWSEERFTEVWEEIQSGRIESKDADKLLTKAEADLTMIGHTTLRNIEKVLGGGPVYVPSYEWGGDEVTSGKEYKEVLIRSIEEADLDPEDFGPEIAAEFEP